jgi:hypothetical protein
VAAGGGNELGGRFVSNAADFEGAVVPVAPASISCSMLSINAFLACSTAKLRALYRHSQQSNNPIAKKRTPKAQQQV